jgi:hypothetical protein
MNWTTGLGFLIRVRILLFVTAFARKFRAKPVVGREGALLEA